MKRIVLIETPVFMKSFTQVKCEMTDEELEQAKRERPDLVFRLIKDLPISLPEKEEVKEERPPSLFDDETRGITVRGMTLPYDFEDKVQKVLDPNTNLKDLKQE
jgi:hypothetical protein